jgi:hypothetical protein
VVLDISGDMGSMLPVQKRLDADGSGKENKSLANVEDAL